MDTSVCCWTVPPNTTVPIFFFSIFRWKRTKFSWYFEDIELKWTHYMFNKLLEKTHYVPLAQDTMICRKFGWLWLKSTELFSTAAKLCKRFSLTDKTFRKFAKAFRDGTILNSKGVRPPTFDDISCKSITDVSVQELKLDIPDFLKLINKEAELTASRRGKSTYQFTAPCRKLSFARRSLWILDLALQNRPLTLEQLPQDIYGMPSLLQRWTS